MRHRSSIALGSALLLLAVTALADYPADPSWWTANGTAILIANFTGNTHLTNYEPVNLGQLKFVAYQAKQHLDTELAAVGGSGPDITSLVNGFVQNSTYNFAPVNLGQLKAVAQPFYDRLIAIGFNTTLSLQNNGLTGYTGLYPWNSATNVSVNYLPANIGQLKLVFSFDLTGANATGTGSGGSDSGGNNSTGYTVPANLSVQNDGIPDKWKTSNHLNPFDPNLAHEALESNGYTVAQAYADGTNPGNSTGDVDSDGDGVPDSEDALPLDPNFSYARQPVPQYAVIDLGPGVALDMDDNGDVLIGNVDTGNATLWSQGNFTALPDYDADGDDPDYSNITWLQLASDGSVIGWDNYSVTPGYGFDFTLPARATVAGDGTVTATEPPMADVAAAAGDTTPYEILNSFLYADATGKIYFNHASDDANDYDISMSTVLCWDTAGDLSTVGDTIPAFINHGTTFSGGARSILLSTTPQGDQLWLVENITGGDYITSEYDTDTQNFDPYLSAFTTQLYLNDQPIPGTLANFTLPELGTSTGDAVDGTYDAAAPPLNVVYGTDLRFLAANLTHALAIPPTYTSSRNAFLDDDTIQYNEDNGALGDATAYELTPLTDNATNSVYANLANDTLSNVTFPTAFGNTTTNPASFQALNGIGLGIGPYGGYLWLNGHNYALTDLCPPGYYYVSVTHIASNSTLASGLNYPDGTYPNSHAILLVPCSLAVDTNNDGNIDLVNDSDLTSPARPFRFWLNDDVDRTGGYSDYSTVQEDLNPANYTGNLDYNLDTIPGTRDLEDFARLWVTIGGLQDAISGGNIYVGLKWTGNITGTPAIKLFVAVQPDASYLTDNATATTQVTGNYGIGNYGAAIVGMSATGTNTTVVQSFGSGNYDYIFPQSVFANLAADNTTVPFLFEGRGRGQGELSLVFLEKIGGNYTKIGDGPGVYMDLRDIKELYERWTVGDGHSGVTETGGNMTLPASTPQLSTSRLPSGVTTPFQYTTSTQGLSATTDSGNDTYILFVHGWRLEPWERDSFAETAFKRLHWQGYNGKFGAFQWPTTYDFATVDLPTSFNEGEYTAWLSGSGLRYLLTHQLQSYSNANNIYVMAHSHGNVVVAEALREADQQGPSNMINTYVASQAAITGEVYDTSLLGNSTEKLDFSFLENPFGSNVTVGEPYGPDTADVYPGWVTTNGSTVAAGGKANFYNTNDFALTLWRANEKIKPSGSYPPTSYVGGWLPMPTYNLSVGNSTVYVGNLTDSAVTSGTYQYVLSSNTTYTDGTILSNLTNQNPYAYTGSVSATPVKRGFSKAIFIPDSSYGGDELRQVGSYILSLEDVNGSGQITNLRDRFEIMSYAGEPRVFPLGAISGSVAGFSGQGLQSLWPSDSLSSAHDYSELPWHSAQFQFDNMDQHHYWGALMVKFGQTPISP